MQESIVFLVRVQCRRKESSRSLSHLLMSFLYFQHCFLLHCFSFVFILAVCIALYTESGRFQSVPLPPSGSANDDPPVLLNPILPMRMRLTAFQR